MPEQQPKPKRSDEVVIRGRAPDAIRVVVPRRPEPRRTEPPPREDEDA